MVAIAAMCNISVCLYETAPGPKGHFVVHKLLVGEANIPPTLPLTLNAQFGLLGLAATGRLVKETSRAKPGVVRCTEKAGFRFAPSQVLIASL